MAGESNTVYPLFNAYLRYLNMAENEPVAYDVNNTEADQRRLTHHNTFFLLRLIFR